MKDFCAIALLFAISIFVGCASHTIINTYPQGAKVRVEGEFIGISPVNWEDHGLAGTGIEVYASKDGYKDTKATITKDNLYVHRIFWLPVLSWPWVMGYRDQYTIELERDKNSILLKEIAAPINNAPPAPPHLDIDQGNRIFLTSNQLPTNVRYEIIKQLEVGGNWYGSSDQALQWLADEARAVGANAVIEIKTWHRPTGSSWAAPFGSGIAIRIITPGTVDYSRLGGTWK